MNCYTLTHDLFFQTYDLDPVVYVSSRLTVSLGDDLVCLVEDIAPFVLDALEAKVQAHMGMLGLWAHMKPHCASAKISGQDIHYFQQFSGVPSLDDEDIRRSVEAQAAVLHGLVETAIEKGRRHSVLSDTSERVTAALCALHEWGRVHPTRSDVLGSTDYPADVTRHVEQLDERGRELFEGVVAHISVSDWLQWPQTSVEEFEHIIDSHIAHTGHWA